MSDKKDSRTADCWVKMRSGCIISLNQSENLLPFHLNRVLTDHSRPRCFQEHIKRWELLAKSERETASALSSVHMPPRICDPSSLLKQIEIVDQLREAVSTDLSSPGTSSGAYDFDASRQFGCLSTGIADATDLPSLPLHENNPSIDEHSGPTGSQFAHTLNKDFQGLDHNQSISSNHS